MGAPFHLPRTVQLGLSPRDRKAVEDEIERLIALLDTIDGDPDLDDDREGDPLDEMGEEPAACGRELLNVRPIYGVDQSRGPINEREALRARQEAIWAEGDALYRRRA